MQWSNRTAVRSATPADIFIIYRGSCKIFRNPFRTKWECISIIVEQIILFIGNKDCCPKTVPSCTGKSFSIFQNSAIICQNLFFQFYLF